MPICGDDQRLKGMLTDRDIVVKALAHDMDPATARAGELAQGAPRRRHGKSTADKSDQ